MRARRLLAQALDRARGDGDAGIGGDEGGFQVVPEGGVDGRPAEDLLEVGDVGAAAGLQVLAEAPPEAGSR